MLRFVTCALRSVLYVAVVLQNLTRQNVPAFKRLKYNTSKNKAPATKRP